MSASVHPHGYSVRAALISATLVALALPGPSTVAAQAIVASRISIAPGGWASPRWQPGSGYPELVAGATDGRIAVAWAINGNVAVAVSPDGGVSWGPGQTLGQGALARLSLSIAPGGPIDVAWTREQFPGPGQELIHRRSTDGGSTFGLEHVVGPGNPLSFIIAGDDGSLLALLQDSFGVHARSSVDGGATWSPPADIGIYPSTSAALWLDLRRVLVCGHNWAAGWRCVRSEDGGLAFGPPRDVVPASLPAWASLLTFGPSFVGFAWRDNRGVHLIRSSDAGDTWEAPLQISFAADDSVEFSAEAGDEIWALLRSAGTARLLRSYDGIVWIPSPVPGTFDCPDIPLDLVSLGLGRGRLGGFFGWSTADAGASWQGPVSVNDFKAPIRGARLLRQPVGRLIALSLEGSGAASWIVARVSDDNGRSWSPPVAVNDVVEVSELRSSRVDARLTWNAVATREGPIHVVWLADGGTGCRELRTARSDDGLAWQASARVGDVDEGAVPRIAGAGPERVVVLLSRELGATLVSRSLDGGATWSVPGPVVSSPLFRGQEVSAELVTAADGSLLFTASERPPLEAFQLIAWRSRDAGATWTGSVVTGRPIVDPDIRWIDDLTLVAAGERLIAGGRADGNKFSYLVNFQSWDRGATWSSLPYIGGRARAGGDDGGLIADGTTWSGKLIAYISANGDRFELGELAAPGPDYSAVLLGPYQAGLLITDTNSIGGLLYAHARYGAPAALRRDDSVLALEPRPFLGGVFPLAPYPTATAFPTMTDPDRPVLRDAARPLVFYQLGFDSLLPLQLTKFGDDIVIDW